MQAKIAAKCSKNKGEEEPRETGGESTEEREREKERGKPNVRGVGPRQAEDEDGCRLQVTGERDGTTDDRYDTAGKCRSDEGKRRFNAVLITKDRSIKRTHSARRYCNKSYLRPPVISRHGRHPLLHVFLYRQAPLWILHGKLHAGHIQEEAVLHLLLLLLHV